MRVGVAPHRLWPGRADELDTVLGTAMEAERLGFDHLVASHHVLAGERGLTPDPLILLAALAGATTRIGLVSSVALVPLYEPAVLAHQTATLDRLARGRFTFGAGVGWDAAEFAEVGVPLAGRGARADAHLARVTALWRDERLGVPPHTPGGPPVWIGGQSDAALRRALRFGAAWHGAGGPEEIAGIRARIAALAEGGPRDPASLALTGLAFLVPPGFAPAGPLPGRPLGGEDASARSVREEVAGLRDAGLAAISLWLPVAAEALPEALEWTAREVLPVAAG